MSAADASFYLIVYVVAINVVTMAFAVLDRFLAPLEGARVPEKWLLTLSLLGGAAGAKLVQMVVHHKKLKYDYTAALSLIAIFQLAMAGGAWTVMNASEDRLTLAQILSIGAEEEEKSAPPKRIQMNGGGGGGSWKPF